MVVLPYYYQFFWLASLASIIYILHVYILPSSTFSMERPSFLYISLIQIMKRIQLPIPCFYKRVFSYFLSGILKTILHHLSPKISGGGPPSPSPTQLPCNLRVCVERGLQLYKISCPTVSTESKVVCNKLSGKSI